MADSLVRLRIDSNEFDAKLKTASQNLQSYFDKVKQGAGTFEHLDDGVLDCAKALGQLSTKSNTARGSIAELTSSFTEWSLRYKQMTDAEKNTPLGREIKNSLDQLKTRIQDTKKDLADIGQELSGSKFGQFGSIIDGIGHKMGVSANLTELLTSKTALMTAGIGAAVAAIYKGTEAWTKYNAELSKQDQQTQVITGLKGSEADHMTDVMRAISDTYKVDFRQAVEAANTLMSQFGVSGSEAIQLIKDGMQGMIQGDGPKLLSMIQQYAPAFRDAGVSASQLVAVIHNSEGGIFTDQNMSAIVMGIKNIRLMTKQTSDALAKLGIDGNQMSQQLSNGSLTVFDALKQVASELKNVGSGSQVAGEVMQTVFGRQGAMAGTNLAKAIETLNTNLEETKKQTGELGDAFTELQTANEKLNTAIRDAFSYDGWEQMATGIKAKLVTALADVLQKLADIKAQIQGITPPSKENAEQARLNKRVDEVRNASKDEREDIVKKHRSFYSDMESFAWRKYNNAQANLKNGVGYYRDERGKPVSYVDESRKYKQAAENYRRYGAEFENEVKKITSQEQNKPEPPKPGPNDPKTIIKPTTTATAKELNPMQQAQKEISALTEEALTADEGRRKVIKEEIADLQKQVEEYKKIQDYVTGKGAVAQVSEEKVNKPLSVSDMIVQEREKMGSQQTALDSNIFSGILQDSIKNNIDVGTLLDSANLEIQAGIDVPDETWQAILDKYNELRAQIGEEPITIDFNSGKIAEDGKKADKTWKDAASAVQSVGSAFSQIEDPAAKAMGTVMQAIASIALGFAQASAQAGSMGPWAWLAFLAAGAAATATTISTIHSLTGFAEGGIVPGNSFSGDNLHTVDYGINSGELILNRSQQSTIASALMESDNSRGGYVGTPYVTGEKIVLGINNYARRSGRGELVFSK